MVFTKNFIHFDENLSPKTNIDIFLSDKALSLRDVYHRSPAEGGDETNHRSEQQCGAIEVDHDFHGARQNTEQQRTSGHQQIDDPGHHADLPGGCF